MAPQNEGDPKYRDSEIERVDLEDGTTGSGSVDVESGEQQPEPFADDDPFRTTRISALSGETAELLEQVSQTPVGIEGSSRGELQHFQSDALERSRWSKARSDGFLGILRLGRKTPPRSARIL